MDDMPEYWGSESAPADRWGTEPNRGDAVRIAHEITGDGPLASRLIDALIEAGIIVEDHELRNPGDDGTAGALSS